MKQDKRKYRVVVRNSSNKIEAMHTFDNYANAVECFYQFINERYSHYNKITIEAIQK
jgi:hypothetical protein